MRYNLLYNSAEFLVISKNNDVDFHATSSSRSLSAEIREKEKINELYPVHRLDKMTSGLMIFAKTRKHAKGLSLLFKTKRIEKYYIAISNKKPKKTQGLISGDMHRSRRGAWKLVRSKKNPASTYFFSSGCGTGYRGFILKPITGKTHQLRVALKSIGSPIIGDKLYSRADCSHYDRGYLHSYLLRFKYNDKEYCFVDRPVVGEFFLSSGFLEFLKKNETPWTLNWPDLKIRRSK